MNRTTRRKGAVLVIVLWVVIMLSVILLNMGYSVRTETMITSNFVHDNDLRQIARSGIDYAMAVLDEDIEPVDHLGEIWADDEQYFSKHEINGGTFTLIRFEKLGEEFILRNGLEDEAGKLNLRGAGREELQKLGGLTEEQISAILDWQDQDSEPQPLGAESDVYMMRERPHMARNKALTTLDELLLVRGMDYETLYGEDWNRNGVLDPAENDGDKTPPNDDEDGVLDLGIAPFVTVYSVDLNRTKQDTARTNINTADENALKQGIPGLTEEEARAIYHHRQDNKFDSVGELLEVEEVVASPTSNGNGNANNANAEGAEAVEWKKTGKKIITPERLKEIIDYCKFDDDDQKIGRININTASERVLATLPGIDEGTARQIVTMRREQKKVFENVAELLDVPGITQENFIKLTERVTVRSYQFKITSEAEIENVKGTKRIVAVVDRSEAELKTLYWNEQ